MDSPASFEIEYFLYHSGLKQRPLVKGNTLVTLYAELHGYIDTEMSSGIVKSKPQPYELTIPVADIVATTMYVDHVATVASFELSSPESFSLFPLKLIHYLMFTKKILKQIADDYIQFE